MQTPPEAIVPCNGCTACCKKALIVLFPEAGDRIAAHGDNVDPIIKTLPGGKRVFTLKKKIDGSCIYLTDLGCSAHALRPVVCRVFDCRGVVRGLVAQHGPMGPRLAVRKGQADRDVIAAGQRLIKEEEAANAEADKTETPTAS